MENVLQEVGSCGKFQICHVALVQLCRLVTAWAQSVMMFGLYNPGWRCVQTNYTTITDLNLSSTSDYTTPPIGTLSQRPYGCDALHISTTLEADVNHTLKTNFGKEFQESSFTTHSKTCSVIDTCAHIEFAHGSSTVASEFGLVCNKVWIGYFIVSVLNGGMLIGALIWGQIGERFGRKIVLYSSTFIIALSSGLAIVSPIWEVYATITLFIGFGVSGVVPTSVVLTMEFLASEWRPRVSSLPIWNVGTFLFAVTTFILRDWKHIHLATSFACGIAFLGFLWTPESVRWLIIHGKTSRAENVIHKISKMNKRHISSETLRVLKEEKETNETKRHYTYLDLFKTRQIRFLILRLGFVWASTILVYEVISFGIQAFPGDFYTNFIIASIIEFPGPLLIAPTANRLGRRRTGFLFASLGVLCCVCIVVSLLAMENGGVRDTMLTSFAFLNKLSGHAIVSLMITYSAELLPTAVRNLSFAFFTTSVRIIGIIGPFLLPRDYPSMIACFAVLMIIQMVEICVFFSLKETKGQPLTDVLPNADETKDQPLTDTIRNADENERMTSDRHHTECK